MTPLPTFISPLFVPAHRPDRFAKAAVSGADAIILDLEDAVPLDAKDAARAALTTDFTDLPVIVRINAVGTPWHAEDVAAACTAGSAAIMLPKAESAADLASIVGCLPIVALIETVRGVAEARSIAASRLAPQIAFGSIDYAADLGCAHERNALASARAELVFASRLGSLPPPLDGVTTDVANPTIAENDARYARAMGFGGKLVIHPRQIDAVKDGFRPSDNEIAWAKRVLDSDDGAIRIDGAMVDAPVRNRARAILLASRN